MVFLLLFGVFQFDAEVTEADNDNAAIDVSTSSVVADTNVKDSEQQEKDALKYEQSIEKIVRVVCLST